MWSERATRAKDCTVARVGLSQEKEPELAAWGPIQLDRLPTVVLAISSLVLAESPRQGGESADHVEVLAESEAQLPPIVDKGQLRRVHDGWQRIRAGVWT